MKQETLVWTALLLISGLFIAYRATAHGSGRVYVKQVDGMYVSATAWDAETGLAQVSLERTLGLWLAAIFTLSIFSFLYKDNPFYKTAESVVVGVSAAYWMVVGFWTPVMRNLIGVLFPEWVKTWAYPDLSPIRVDAWFLYFVPLVLGAMLLWRLAPKGAWIARWPLAFIIGTFAGIRMLGYIEADFLSQIANTIRPLYVAGNMPSTLANITLVSGVLACLVYFFFSVEHKGFVGRISVVGIWFLMSTFGAAFGSTVMGRIALLAIRLEFLFDDWLWLIDPTGDRPPSW